MGIFKNRSPSRAAAPVTQQKNLHLACAAAPLPEDVYDIVIDPGHGGTDAGSLSPDQKHYEKDIVLEIAHKTKAALEELGYKVLLTRDGTEDPKTKMAYTMYDADGRETVSYSIIANAVSSSKPIPGPIANALYLLK